MVDARAERAKSLAKDKRIKRVEGAMWFVPSQSQNAGGYLVNMLAASCTCPDHELGGKKCKHVIAVELTQVVEAAADGQHVVTEAEQDNVRTALAFLRARSGGFKPLSKALRLAPTTLRGPVTPLLAFRVARLASVGVDDVLSRRYPPPGACPHCGHVTHA
jgi:predicted nucleic acid-binding Zn finger protein